MVRSIERRETHSQIRHLGPAWLDRDCDASNARPNGIAARCLEKLPAIEVPLA